MTQTPNPTWYDVLGVAPDASAAEIKSAWRHATDKFEPGSGSGQFRMFNDAADVLLDPRRRAAYDESLGDEGHGAAAPGEHATPARREPVPAAAATSTASTATTARPEEATTTSAEKSTAPDRERRFGRRSTRTPRPSRQGRAVRPVGPVGEPASRGLVLLTAALALLTIAALVAVALLGLQVRRDTRVADARAQAPAAAERAAKAVLAYDYRTLPADRRRASTHLTDDFRPKYLENFELLEKQKDGTAGAAVQSKTVVESSVLGSGVMDASEDRVRVLVYVNQTSTKPGVDPQIFQNRVTMTMEKQGNRWLVDALKSY